MKGLLKAAPIGYQILYHLPVHKRFPAEEIHLQVDTASGIFHQEIQGLFPYLIAHKRSSSMILSLLCKAVFAGKIAVMGNMKAQRLYHGLSLFEIKNIIFINIRCIKLSHFLQLHHLLISILNICCFIFSLKLFKACGFYLFLSLILQQFLCNGDQIINHIVHYMNGTAVHIQNDVIAVILVLMYHFLYPYLSAGRDNTQ